MCTTTKSQLWCLLFQMCDFAVDVCKLANCVFTLMCEQRFSGFETDIDLCQKDKFYAWYKSYQYIHCVQRVLRVMQENKSGCFFWTQCSYACLPAAWKSKIMYSIMQLKLWDCAQHFGYAVIDGWTANSMKTETADGASPLANGITKWEWRWAIAAWWLVNYIVGINW